MDATGLAWVITGGMVLELGRRPKWWVSGMLGVAGACWAQYWPSARGVLEIGIFAVCILGLGLVVRLSHWVMDRVQVLPRPSGWVLLVASLLAPFGGAAGQGRADGHEAEPAAAGFACDAGVDCEGDAAVGTGAEVALGSGTAGRNLGFLVAPTVMVGIAPIASSPGWRTMAANWVVALGSSLVAVVW